MTALAVVGGSGLDKLEALEDLREQSVVTPWGPPSGPLVSGRVGNLPLTFLARHGPAHDIPPHEINYRANMWALYEAGVRSVIGVAAVGGIADEPGLGGIVIPDQLIDYTWGREHTYSEHGGDHIAHVDFTVPYSPPLRERLLRAARQADVDAQDGGCYAATQGPRLETAAEIRRMERDGCTIVGMTGMPEAGLARELGLEYACCAVVCNPAAGVAGDAIIAEEEIRSHLRTGMSAVCALLTALSHEDG